MSNSRKANVLLALLILLTLSFSVISFPLPHTSYIYGDSDDGSDGDSDDGSDGDSDDGSDGDSDDGSDGDSDDGSDGDSDESLSDQISEGGSQAAVGSQSLETEDDGSDGDSDESLSDQISEGGSQAAVGSQSLETEDEGSDGDSDESLSDQISEGGSQAAVGSQSLETGKESILNSILSPVESLTLLGQGTGGDQYLGSFDINPFLDPPQCVPPDPGCTESPNCQPDDPLCTDESVNCDDGKDNDNDGKTDDADEDCQQSEGPPLGEICDNGIDDNNNGRIDEDCGGPPPNSGPNNRDGDNNNRNNNNNRDDNRNVNTNGNNIEDSPFSLVEAQALEDKNDGDVYYIVIENSKNGTRFVPNEVTVTKGFVVVWINNDDSNNHHLAIKSDAGDLLLDALVRYKNSVEYEFKSEGTFHYSDSENPQINGIITILDNNEESMGKISKPLQTTNLLLSTLSQK